MKNQRSQGGIERRNCSRLGRAVFLLRYRRRHQPLIVAQVPAAAPAWIRRSLVDLAGTLPTTQDAFVRGGNAVFLIPVGMAQLVVPGLEPRTAASSAFSAKQPKA